jgi:alkylation response protein AidB-like acyl-CoA dehydrogenase
MGSSEGRPISADPAEHLDLSEAAMRIRSARLLLNSAGELVCTAGERASELSVEVLAELRARTAFIVRLSTEAVDRLFAASGADALRETNPLQRFWRDVHPIHAYAGLTGARTRTTMAACWPICVQPSTIHRPW